MKLRQLIFCQQNQQPLKKHLLLAHLLRYEAQIILGILSITIEAAQRKRQSQSLSCHRYEVNTHRN
jgi:hypothetical protein